MVPRRFRAALFDFDGTLSLLREGWPDIMVGMMVDRLRDDGLAPEPAEATWRAVEEFVLALNGRPTLVQMERFAAEVRERGGVAELPATYGAEYRRRLLAVVERRWLEIASGQVVPADWAVPHAHQMLDALERRGVALYLASGSELAHVRYEAELLDVARYFTGRLHAPLDGDPTFTKRQVIEQLLRDEGISGAELVGFGDGVVETEEVVHVGGVAVGVASRPRGERGVHSGKRDLLAAAGAALIVADYENHAELLSRLFEG